VRTESISLCQLKQIHPNLQRKEYDFSQKLTALLRLESPPVAQLEQQIRDGESILVWILQQKQTVRSIEKWGIDRSQISGIFDLFERADSKDHTLSTFGAQKPR